MAKQVLLTGSYQYTEEQIHMIEKLGWKVTFVKNELEPIGVPADQFDVVVCNGLFLHNDIADGTGDQCRTGQTSCGIYGKTSYSLL